MLLQRPRDVVIELLPAAPREGAIGGVLDQRVLEEERGVGEHPFLDEQPGVDQRRSSIWSSPVSAGESARSSGKLSSRPMTPMTEIRCAVSFAVERRSSRAIRESCRLAGASAAGSWPASV